MLPCMRFRGEGFSGLGLKFRVLNLVSESYEGWRGQRGRNES